MSGETFSAAIFIVTAVVAATILITAIFPIVTNTAGTLSDTAANEDTKQRTQFTVINTLSGSETMTVWIKNTGTGRIGINSLDNSNFFSGTVSRYSILKLRKTSGDLSDGEWKYSIIHSVESNNYLDPGETIQIDAKSDEIPVLADGNDAYFKFVLPSGISIAKVFTPNI